MTNDFKRQRDLTALLIAMVEIAYEVRALGFEEEYESLDKIIQNISYENLGPYKKSA